jgi:predicted GTPase
MEEEKLSS